MRRLDLHPKKKLRNRARHLRQLALWPERIIQHLPNAADLKAPGFWNFKVPVFAKLVEPPHATVQTQRACMAAIFAAAAALERAPDRPKACRIACLVTTPFMFESEVTIFANEDYFCSFLPGPGKTRTEFSGGWVEASPADPVELALILPVAPEGLAFMGGTRLVQHDPEWELSPVTRLTWVWAFERR